MFGKSDLNDIHQEELQRAVEGGGKSVVPRLEYRQKVALSRLNAEPMLLLRSSTKKSEDVMKVHAEERLAPQCDRVGFKCLHYEVSEGDGHVSVVVVNKLGTHLEIGLRTIDGTALAG